MKTLVISRRETGDEGTFGDAVLFNRRRELFECVSLELPWLENAPRVSCVPAGDYLFKWREDSPTWPDGVYEEWDDPDTTEAEDVEGRDFIQIHPANLAGSAAAGYKAELLGCIAVGRTIARFPAGTIKGQVKDQRGVTSSYETYHALLDALEKDEVFRVVICWAPAPKLSEA